MLSVLLILNPYLFIGYIPNFSLNILNRFTYMKKSVTDGNGTESVKKLSYVNCFYLHLLHFTVVQV